MNNQHTAAYSLGYRDGREFGYETVDTLTMTDKDQHEYRIGYDRGIADYCAAEHSDEE